MGVALFEKGRLGGVENGVGVEERSIGQVAAGGGSTATTTSAAATTATATTTAAALVAARHGCGFAAALSTAVGDGGVVVEGDKAQAVEAFEDADEAGKPFLLDIERGEAGAFGFAQSAAREAAAASTAATAGAGVADVLNVAVHAADGPVVIDTHAGDEIDEFKVFFFGGLDGGFVGGSIGPAFDEGFDPFFHLRPVDAGKRLDVGNESGI